MNLEKVNCNLCGSNHEVILIKSPDGNIVRCVNCGLVYSNPRFSFEEELNNYVDRIEPHYQWVNPAKEKIFLRQLKFLNVRLPGKTSSTKLLDVGCSDGYFLQLASESGFDIWGVEMSRLAASLAEKRLLDKKERIYAGTLREANFPDEFFQVITLWDICDQFCDPSSELLEVYRVLAKDGLLMLRTRNADFHLTVYRMFCAVADKLKVKPTIFHLYSFSAGTMKKMLLKSGWHTVEVKNSELTVGDPYSGGKIFGSFGMKMIKKAVFCFSQLICCLSLKKIFLSPSLIIFAWKKGRL
ncbi:MAG: class I SAM-dependent methyltransferase [Elusimicrobiota bacterium]